MPRFVVLLRGVNVGSSNRVPMAAFRALLERQLGYAGVRTLLNSGNAVFDDAGRSAARHAGAIAAALHSELAVDVPVLVKSGNDLAAVIAGCPLPPAEAGFPRFLVAFAQHATALQGLASLRPLVRPPERFAIGDHAAYLSCPDGIRNSRAARELLGKLGSAVTTRNWATVLKLGGLVGATTIA